MAREMGRKAADEKAVKRMSWADRQLKKEREYRMVQAAMRDPRYVAAQKKELDEVTRKTFDMFLVVTVAYLHDRLGFSRKRIIQFLEYADEQMKYLEDLTDYFETMNEAIREETGVDVMKLEVTDR